MQAAPSAPVAAAGGGAGQEGSAAADPSDPLSQPPHGTEVCCPSLFEVPMH